MKAISALAVTLSFAVALPGHSDSRPTDPPPAPRAVGHPVLPRPVARHVAAPKPLRAASIAPAELNGVVKQYCQKCHNPTMRRGNLSLADFDVGAPDAKAEVAEKVVAKLRSGMMQWDRRVRVSTRSTPW